MADERNSRKPPYYSPSSGNQMTPIKSALLRSKNQTGKFLKEIEKLLEAKKPLDTSEPENKENTEGYEF